MGEFAELILDGVFCEECGEFINAEPVGQTQKCEECFEEELVEAVEKDVMPDDILFMDWLEIKRKYSEPDVRA